MRPARSASRAFLMTSLGRNVISVIMNPLSASFSSFPLASALKLTNSSFEFSAIARNVVMKHELTDATKRCSGVQKPSCPLNSGGASTLRLGSTGALKSPRSEEHTSELQSQSNLVCRLLLEKKKKKTKITRTKNKNQHTVLI